MDQRPRNLKAMLSEAKDTSELMVDLGYAALFFADPAMAEEVVELEERLTSLIHEMRAVCVHAEEVSHRVRVREDSAMAHRPSPSWSLVPVGAAGAATASPSS